MFVKSCQQYKADLVLNSVMQGLALQGGHFLMEVTDGLSPSDLMPGGAAQLTEQLLILLTQPLHVSQQLPSCLHGISRRMIARLRFCTSQHVLCAQPCVQRKCHSFTLWLCPKLLNNEK